MKYQRQTLTSPHSRCTLLILRDGAAPHLCIDTFEAAAGNDAASAFALRPAVFIRCASAQRCVLSLRCAWLGHSCASVRTSRGGSGKWADDFLPRRFASIRGAVPRAHGVVASHPLRMRKALGSNPSVSRQIGHCVFFFIAQRRELQKLVRRGGDRYMHGAHGVVVSHPLCMRKALGSNPSVSIFA